MAYLQGSVMESIEHKGGRRLMVVSTDESCSKCKKHVIEYDLTDELSENSDIDVSRAAQHGSFGCGFI